MPKYVIERDLPGAGSFTDEQLREAAISSNKAIDKLGNLQWVESFVTTDKFYCIYIAENEELIKEHARLAGFPADKVSEVKRMTDPTRGE